jgi:hypothetical protein
VATSRQARAENSSQTKKARIPVSHLILLIFEVFFPFVANHLAAREAAHGDDHGARCADLDLDAMAAAARWLPVGSGNVKNPNA